MSRKSAELQDHAARLGLDTSGTRDELMCRIRDHVTQGQDILPQIDVQNAQNGKEFLDYTLEKPWTSPEFLKMWNSEQYVVEPKLDGIRVKMHFDINEYSRNPRLDSRRRSDTDYVYNEKTENFPQFVMSNDLIKEKLINEAHDCVLDGELIQPQGIDKLWNGSMWIEGLQIPASIWNSGPEVAHSLQQNGYHADGVTQGCYLKYVVFDCLRWGGKWLFDEPLNIRRHCAEQAVIQLKQVFNASIEVVPQWRTDVRRMVLFEREIAVDGEGVMFKLVGAPYECGKRAWSWIKLKKFVEISAFISGSIPGTVGKGWEDYIGAFELSVYAGETPTHIASCSGISMAIRQAATILVEGKPVLNPEFLNKVVEVRFQQITSRNQRGRHAVLVRFRDDQTPHDCTNEQAGIAPSGNEMIMEGESV